MKNTEHENLVEFQVSGDYALFSDPIMRVGGEKCTYQVPTYEALKGVLSSVYWKPTLTWIIDAVRVMNPIQMETKGIRPIKYGGGNDLSYYTYLKDCRYQVRAHFEWNENRPELIADRNENKHHEIAKRMIRKGGRRDIFLGCRECQGYVEPCAFKEGPGFYDGYGTLDFGLMFHGFDYPDETGRDMLGVRFWRPRMVDGVIEFIPPEQCDPLLRRDIRPMAKKRFAEKENFTGLSEPALEGLNEEGNTDGLDAGAVQNV